MLDPASSMTTLTPMSDTPITSTHHQLHGSYHGMNHMMGHHHGGPLAGHTPSMNHYGTFHEQNKHIVHLDWSVFNWFVYVDIFFVSAFFALGHHGHPSSHHPAMAAAVAAAGLHPDTDTDPRELEAFAERFKQRRIKLGSYSISLCCLQTLLFSK